jgi:hypothetical protein
VEPKSLLFHAYDYGTPFLNELKDLCPFNPTPHYVMKCSRGIQSGLSGHKNTLCPIIAAVKFIQKQRPLDPHKAPLTTGLLEQWIEIDLPGSTQSLLVMRF